MLIWILAALDFIVAINLIALHFGFFTNLAIYSILYLIIKGFIFIADPFSIIDIIIGVYLLVLLLLEIGTFLTWIFVAYLIYKVLITFTVA